MMSYYIISFSHCYLVFWQKINSCSFIKDHWKVKYVHFDKLAYFAFYLIADSD